MKIKYAATINLDDNKYRNLDKAYVRDQVIRVLDGIISAMEDNDHELHFLIDENKEQE
jgi:hypothetical protein